MANAVACLYGASIDWEWRHITGGIIVFKGAVNWNMSSGPPAWDQMDLASISAHEFGHAIGLGHATANQIMSGVSPGEQRRWMQTGDYNGRCQVYYHAHGYAGGCWDQAY